MENTPLPHALKRIRWRFPFDNGIAKRPPPGGFQAAQHRRCADVDAGAARVAADVSRGADHRRGSIPARKLCWRIIPILMRCSSIAAAGSVGQELAFLGQLLRRRFDLTIGFTEGQRTAWYSRLCGARARFGLVKIERGLRHWAYNFPMYPVRREHEVQSHFTMLADAGLKLHATEPGPLCLVVPEADRVWAREQLAPLQPARIVHVHPVSRWLWKCWDNTAMAATIDWLQSERGARVVVTTGPAERERETARAIVAHAARHRSSSTAIFRSARSRRSRRSRTATSASIPRQCTWPRRWACRWSRSSVRRTRKTGAHGRLWAAYCRSYCICNDVTAKEKCDWSRARACLAAITVQEAQAALDEMLAMRKLDPASVV